MSDRDQKITGLTELTTPADDDYIYIVDSSDTTDGPSGSSRKAQLANARGWPQTSAESTAGVTPTNLQYEPGNVLRYGATGDGATDDTTAIANALLAARQDIYSSVYFPKGTYLVSSPLTCDRVSLYGDLGYSTIKSSGLTSGQFIINCGLSVAYANARPTIKNLQIDGNSECGGISLNVRHHNVENCYIVNCDAAATTPGIFAERNTQLIKNCHIDTCGIGIDLDGITNATIAGTDIVNNHITGCTTAGIRANEAACLNIKENVIQSCGTEIILDNGANSNDFDAVNIVGNYFEDQGATKDRFIYLNPNLANDIETINIKDNYFFGGNVVGAVAITVGKAEVVNVTGNFFRGVPYCIEFSNNNADTSGVFEGNALSTNVTSAFDTADSTTTAAMRKFRFGKNKNFNAKVSGTATITTTNASVTITHNMDITPENIIVSYYDTTDAVVNSSGVLFTGSVGSSTFDITRDTAASNNAKVAYVAWFGEL